MINFYKVCINFITKTKEIYRKRKLNTNMLYEHKNKNTHQDANKFNMTANKNDNKSWSSWVHPRNSELV